MMTSWRSKLTDSLLEEALTRRAAGERTSAELVDDVLAVVATAPQRGRWSLWLAPPQRLVPVLLLTGLLLAALVGLAVVAGGGSSPDEVLSERRFVEPFIGLPPEEAAPSSPETGELIVSFGGRVHAIGEDFHRVWLYADGRLIWKRNLDNRTETRAFGASEPTTAVIEQHLTPEGVDLMRADVMATARILEPASAGEDTTVWGRPGVLWGGMTVGVADQLFDATWSDSHLPARLANPASWLPASAWADQRIGGYVPSRYAVCLLPDLSPQTLDRLPGPARKTLLANGTVMADTGGSTPTPQCYEVTTDVAREIAAALDAAGNQPEQPGDAGLRYAQRRGRVPEIRILPIVPHGEPVCNCG
jgi:hypothetical protein